MDSGIFKLRFVAFLCLVLSVLLPTTHGVSIQDCSGIAQQNNKVATNYSQSYVQQLLECLQIQQSALEETSLNLTNMIVNLKSSKEKRYAFHKVELNWTEAAESCNAEMQALATIKNKREHDKYMADMPKGYIHASWIGGFDPTNRGNFVWIGKDGKPDAQFTYQSWAEGQPRRTCSQEYDECISSMTTNNWAVTSCGAKMFYVCEYYSVPLNLD